MNRFDIINRIGDKYRVGNTETSFKNYLSSMTSSIILAPSLKLFRNSRHSAIA